MPINIKLTTIFKYELHFMDWEAAKNHCAERNWQWSLEFIRQAQTEMEELEAKVKKLEDEQKAQRLYNACNY